MGRAMGLPFGGSGAAVLSQLPLLRDVLARLFLAETNSACCSASSWKRPVWIVKPTLTSGSGCVFRAHLVAECGRN